MKKIRPHIAFILGCFANQPTGIGYYSYGFISEFVKLYKDKFLISVIVDKHLKDGLIDKLHVNQSVISNPFPVAKTYLWHLTLPFRLKTKFSWMFNVSSTPHMVPLPSPEILFVYDLSTFIFPKTHPLLRVLYTKLVLPFALKKARYIICPSENTKKDLIMLFNINPNKIRTIMIPPKYTQNRWNIKKEKKLTKQKYILTVSTLEPRKNIETIINSYAEFIKDNNNRDILLYIVGKEGWKYKSIYRAIDKHRLTKKVKILGYVNNSFKIELYKYTLFLMYLPLYEGFGIPVYEANYFGCPAITSSNSSLKELFSKSTFQVNPLNTKFILSAMTLLSRDVDYRNYIIKEGFKNCTRISNRGIKNIKKFAKEILSCG